MNSPLQSDIDAVVALTNRLNSMPIMTNAEKRRLDEAARFDFLQDYTEADVKTHHERWRIRAFDGLDDVSGHKQIIAKNQDLGWQVWMMNRCLEDWFDRGHSLPPHYPIRICVLLRKAKRFDEERAFLASYFRHFSAYPDKRLADRATKIGIEIKPDSALHLPQSLAADLPILRRRSKTSSHSFWMNVWLRLTGR